MKKKIMALALCVALAAIAVVGATLAYFTDTAEEKNTFTVGNVKIELEEPNWESSGKEDAPEVYPGEPLAKDPQVTNIGDNPCFVRLKITGFDCLESLGTTDAEKAELTVKYRTNYEIDALGENWVKHTDGYYYYTKVLENKNDKTTAVFDQVVIPTALKNLPAGVKNEFNINVVAEAVQAQGAKPSFASVKTMTVEEIAAWFTTCGLN